MPRFIPPTLAASSSSGFDLGDHADHLVTFVTPLYDEREGQYGAYYAVKSTALCHTCRRGFKSSTVTGGVAQRLASTIIINERAKPPRPTPFLSGRVVAVEGLAPGVKPRFQLDDVGPHDGPTVDGDLQRCATLQRSGEMIVDVLAFEEDDQTLPIDEPVRQPDDDRF